jgi:hypothetical protein
MRWAFLVAPVLAVALAADVMGGPGVEEKDRPTGFETKGAANVTFVFERVKEEKK